WRRGFGVDCAGCVIPPAWQIHSCWTEPLRAAGPPPIGESISPTSPARRISNGMAYFAGTGSVFASADFP
ncbi:MAG: hypothetical protein ACOYM3_28775, partial [Terrimicrobiaceae bacterium]